MRYRASDSLRKLLPEFRFGKSAVLEYPIQSRSFKNFLYQCTSRQYLKERRQYCHPSISILPKVNRDCRSYSVDSDNEVDKINLKFAEAREEIESAMESKETVYFNEEAECARAAVGDVLEMYEELLKKLPESEKGKVQRAMGLKIEQLKAELEQLNE